MKIRQNIAGGFSWTSENRRTVFLMKDGANVQPMGCIRALYLSTRESPADLMSQTGASFGAKVFI